LQLADNIQGEVLQCFPAVEVHCCASVNVVE